MEVTALAHAPLTTPRKQRARLPNPRDDGTRAIGIVNYFRQRVPNFCQMWCAFRKKIETGIGVVEDRGERLVDFMGDGSGQFAHRGHASDMSELRLRLLQRSLGPLSFGVLRVQCLVGAIEFLNFCGQIIAREPERFRSAFLCGAQQPDHQGCYCKKDEAWQFVQIRHKRMGRQQEVIIECQNRKGDGEQARLESAEPGANHDGAEKQRYERGGLPVMLQHLCEDDCGGNRYNGHHPPDGSRSPTAPLWVAAFQTPASSLGRA